MQPTIDREVPRRLEDIVLDRLQGSPVVVVHGPRTAGKSTVLRRLAARLDGLLVNLDEPATRATAAADPALYATPPRRSPRGTVAG